eukprot:8408589-Heterocapsa_arctica.AAC.1
MTNLPYQTNNDSTPQLTTTQTQEEQLPTNIAPSPRSTHMLHNNQRDQQDTTHDQYCCVDGSCLITVHPDGQRALCDIRTGDQIMAHDGSAVTVICMLQISGFRGDVPLLHMTGGCMITAGHPVWHQVSDYITMHGHECSQSTWTRPNRITAPTMTHCNNLCALIMKDSPAFWTQ